MASASRAATDPACSLTDGLARAARRDARRVRPRPACPRAGQPRAPAAARRPDAAHSEAAPAPPPRPGLLAGGAPAVARLAAAPGRRPTRHRAPLAPAGVAPALVVALRAARRPAAAPAGSAGA